MQDRFRSSRMFDFAITALVVLCLAMILQPAKAATPMGTGYSATAPRADAPPGTPAERPAKGAARRQKAIMMKTDSPSDGARSPMAAPKSQASVAALVSAHSAAVRLEDPGDVRAVAQSGNYKQTTSKFDSINRGDGAGGNFTHQVASR